MQVQCQIPLIQALARCWDPNTVTFNIDGLEFAPTLEEYSAVIGVSFTNPRLVQPPIGIEPKSALAKFLDTSLIEILPILKSNSGRFPLSFLIEKFSRLPADKGTKSGRVFVLAFLSFILFPISSITFDPVMSVIARQVCCDWDYSNHILAETVISLNRFRTRGKGTFRASSELLYIWFTSHIKKYHLRMSFREINQYTHPIKSFVQNQSEVTEHSFSK